MDAGPQGQKMIQQQGALDSADYDDVCARQDSVPLLAVKMNLDKGMLDLNGDKVKATDWPQVLASISISKHLHHIAVSNTYQASLSSADRRYNMSKNKNKIPAILSEDMTFKLCRALKECLTVSPNLKTLHLNRLPLRERDLITLTKGLAKSISLENLSLSNCPISDEGLEVICKSVKNSPSISIVDFTGCNLTWRGAKYMANIIKYQGMQRHGTAWAESLRYRHPPFEGMGGLHRVTLNCNPLIGDQGAAALAQELAEDLWIKAVDLQRCGLSNEGAYHLLQALNTNSSLCVLDIRSNPLVDKVPIETIIEKVLMNANGQSLEYCWIKSVATEPQRAAGPKRHSVGRKSFRAAASKETSVGQNLAAQAQKPHSRRKWNETGMGISVTDQRFQSGATVKVTVDSSLEEDDEEEAEVVGVEQRRPSLNLQDRITEQQFERLQTELKECRLSLSKELRARRRAESRLMEYELENARLRDANRSLSEVLAATGSRSAPPAASVLEDEAILHSIEVSFNKFHAFLDLLRDVGLGQLASIFGIDKLDFHAVVQPQLSSTVGIHFDAAPAVSPRDVPDVQAKIEDFSLESYAPPATPGVATDTTTPRFSSSVLGSLYYNKLLGVTFKKATGEPSVDGEEKQGQDFRLTEE